MEINPQYLGIVIFSNYRGQSYSVYKPLNLLYTI